MTGGFMVDWPFLAFTCGALAAGWMKYRYDRKNENGGNGDGGKECPLHSGITARLQSGEKKFDEILKVLNEHGNGLATLLERTKRL